MDIKEKSRQELEEKIEELEDIIARKGVGSGYLKKAERIQRDLNIALVLGTAVTAFGLTAWVLYKLKQE